MTHLYRVLVCAMLAALLSQNAVAAVVQITVKDVGGTTRNFNVTTNSDLTGNLIWNNTICDQAAGTTCVSVGTAGSPSTNALTTQAITIGSGTAANAARVEVANNGTGVLATVGTVTTLSTLTGGGVASAAADSGNPLKVGGKYNNSPITLTDGNRGDLQLDVNGYAKVNVTNANANVANNADTVAAATACCSPVTNYGYVWNGSTWDRQPGTTVGTKIIGAGTAGTANAAVVTVQGIASMTKLLVTPDANSAVNVSQINGVTPLMGNGATGTGSPRITLVSDGTAISTTGYMSVKLDQTTPGTTNSISFGTDPCSFLAKTNFPIDQAADTQVISGVSAKKTYICSLSIIAAAAETFSVVAGTGTVCATGIAALIGSTTDANGLSFAANGGLTIGNGVATIASGLTNADNICIRQGGTSRIAGNLTYVQN